MGGSSIFIHIIPYLGSNFDKNKILYIMLGVFALATLILLAILCIILYKVSFFKESHELGVTPLYMNITFLRGERDPI